MPMSPAAASVYTAGFEAAADGENAGTTSTSITASEQATVARARMLMDPNPTAPSDGSASRPV